MKCKWSFCLSTSAGIFCLNWCNIQSPATVRQQTYKWGIPSDGWSWMSICLCTHYTSHHRSLLEMCRHSLQDDKTSIHIFIITRVSKLKSLSRCQVANKTLWSSLHEKRKKKKKWLVNRILKHFIFILLNKIVYWICFPYFERYFVS